VVADSRNERGRRPIFGGFNPAPCFYATAGIYPRPNTTGVSMPLLTPKFGAEQATSEQVAATVPEQIWLGDKALYMAA